MTRYRLIFTAFAGGILVLLLVSVVAAQQPPLLPTSTPVQVQLASITPIRALPTSTSTLAAGAPTPTPRNLVLFEVSGEVNVRSSPEITEDNRIGSIRAGERYVVLGQYFNWIQFQYDQVPSNRGWVYRDLIEIIQGDEAVIPVIELNATATVDPLTVGATQTREAILEAPGGALTVTAQSRVLQLPGLDEDTQSEVMIPANETVLPTYTFPPNISLRPTLVSQQDDAIVAVQSGGGISGTTTGIPPLVPILALSFFGVAGLAISVLRS